MAILELGLIRMVHVHGGPYRELRCIQNGETVFVEWPMSGLIRIVLQTGKLWDARKGPWTMHGEDLQRITRKGDPWIFDAPQAVRTDTGKSSPPNPRKSHPSMCSAGSQRRKPLVRKPG